MEARVARRGVNKGNSQREREREGGGAKPDLNLYMTEHRICFVFLFMN